MKTRFRFKFALFCPVFAAICLTGCHPATTEHTTLPSTLPVRKALAVVEDSHQKVQQLVAQAAVHGIAPGSPAAKALTLASTAEGAADAALHRTVDQLTAQLLTAQKQVDATEKDRDAQKARADAAEKSRDAYKAEDHRLTWILIGVVLAFLSALALLGAQLQSLERAILKFAAKELVAVGTAAVHVVEAIPQVAAVAAVV